ncbi:hypothetical protein METBIDRAFT_35090 [Metschnikowia bicuspidata var. bicuspidata NRRL YB-4993]|uniref:FUN14-domain-containing protein n=1 Tax=Metschnikowia bicuspidata var. bicuspidata NRRL YB-4993 TaxID=869754 RepID=A0A1A0HH67_9ASCO|nr:hypothetical protein METBIDRAFT_35090 [Metschnikowia bicuspidata var. bicuspidata NRRL YB-4993]OBA23183.1 hypothetical protein METBIDRAFT_35090 [Metschnikowia bicuspidata var. bicuspidata NRRL YB-4993]
MFTTFIRPGLLKNSLKVVPVILGAGLVLRPATYIRNDAVALSSPQSQYSPQGLDAKIRTSRLGGKLDYSDLSIGSITGLFLGIVIGKLSTAIVFLSLSSYLLLQFLENRGIISIPWTSVLSIGGKKLDLKTLFFNRPSFKLSFMATFLLAAYNA